MNPYFSVGEEVKYQCITNPSYKGEAVVIQIVRGGEITECPHCGSIKMADFNVNGFGYFLDVQTYTRCCDVFAQKSLRKKYDKGEDFESLMEFLKSPDKVAV